MGDIQTGGNRKCYNLRSRSSKILNSRTIPEQAWKSGFFQVHFQYQKNSITIQGIPEPLATLLGSMGGAVECQSG